MNYLSNKGEFITFQYSLLKNNFFQKYFESVKVKKAMINLPPTYVLKCRAKEEI